MFNNPQLPKDADAFTRQCLLLSCLSGMVLMPTSKDMPVMTDSCPQRIMSNVCADPRASMPHQALE